MVISFNDFISTIRTDRLRQIREKQKRGLIISDLRFYRFIDNINLINNGVNYDFGVQASLREIYFYINENGSNCYYDIEDIYNLLRKMCHGSKNNKKYVLNNLNKLLASDSDDSIEKIEGENYFVYQEIQYYFDNPTIEDNGKHVSLLEGDSLISFSKVFVLLNLIQKKSNSFFKNGDKEYVNGLIRMYKVLILYKKNHEILKKKGWFFNYKEKKFVFKFKGQKDNKAFKYYLTEDDYNIIMGGEES